MNKLIWTPLAVLGALSISACGGKADTGGQSGTVAETATTKTASVADADEAPASFGQCVGCHMVAKDGGNGVGPNLHGIVGAKAAQVAGYNYSTALKGSGLVWDEATLDSFILNSRALVAGTKMSYGGQSDPAKRKEIIAWLKKNS